MNNDNDNIDDNDDDNHRDEGRQIGAKMVRYFRQNLDGKLFLHSSLF